MTKGIIIGLIACGLLVAGCSSSKPPVEETTSSSTMGQDQGATTGETGEAERPDRGTVESMNEVIASLKTVYFDFDRYNLRDDARRALEQDAEILKNNPDIKVMVEGHCDERGTNEYNLALGENRANAVRDYLVRLGIDAGRLSTISYGEERPVAMGHDEAAWAQNRRAQFSAR